MYVMDSGDPLNITTDVNVVVTYPIGTSVTYQCQGARDEGHLLRGNGNRTCGEDGAWSGSLPWCDRNVAFKRPFVYSAMDGDPNIKYLSDHPWHALRDALSRRATDGVVSDDDPVILVRKSALGSASGAAYFVVSLAELYAVTEVVIHGDQRKAINSSAVASIRYDFVNSIRLAEVIGTSRLSLANALDCQQSMEEEEELPRAKFVCNKLSDSVGQSKSVDTRGSFIRFEHNASYTLAITQVQVYANPSKITLSLSLSLSILL